MGNFLSGEQYFGTGWVTMLITLIFGGYILYNISRAGKSAAGLYIRRIPGLNAIDEAIGRATEMGRPVMMVPGLSALNANAMQALNIFSNVSKMAARFATPIRLCCADAAVYTVAQEMISEVYRKEGLSERFDSESVQFVSDRQFAFASGVSGILHREQVAAAFFLGEFYAESLIFAETANSIGAIQVAGSTQNTQTPFFIAACDYVLIADEFYAASAYLTRQPILVGSLIGQDWIKLSMMALILIGTGMKSIEKPFMKTTEKEVEGQKQVIPAETTPNSELRFFKLFNPEPPKEEEVPKRELTEEAKAAAAEGAGA